MFEQKATGARESPYDVRTFSYKPSKAEYIHSGGKRYEPKDIENQRRVGICTGISATQNATKAQEKKWSAEFQYYCQKRFYDLEWEEGSSGFSAVRVMKNIGLLPAEEWTYTTEADRDLPYADYMRKIRAIPETEIQRCMAIAAKYKIKAYAQLPNLDRNTLANAINESKAGILVRFVIGAEWWTDPIEPLRPPVKPLSGHLVGVSNFVGQSFRTPNTWGELWADGGTAYWNINDYQPTEAWAVFYDALPIEIEKQLESRESIIGQIMDLIQKIIVLIGKLK